MSGKRAADAPLQGGAARKRARVREQRTIQVQQQQQQQHGPRLGGSAERGNDGLPPTIQPDKFAQSRAFEIAAMTHALKSSKEAAAQRAFQSLPRHLRRRAASHNVKRLPRRLRSKALAETPEGAAKPKKVTRRMLGRRARQNLGITKTAIWKKRQRKKVWLETHIWHAKRMHMIDIWGHRLADKPTEKSFRASYRASRHGALLHDLSYYQYLELAGTVESISLVLDQICDPTGPLPTLPRFTSGARECQTHVYTINASFPSGLIGPAVVLWDTLPTPRASDDVADDDDTGDGETERRVWLRLHPAICVQVLKAVNKLRALQDIDVRVTTFDKQLCTFELTGKRALEVVKGVLRPVEALPRPKRKAWEQLDVARGPSSLPTGTVIGLEVYDPRLSFPPKLVKGTAVNRTIVPSPDVAECAGLWNPLSRRMARKPRYKKADLDERRRVENVVPGTRLRATAKDDRLPVLLTHQQQSSGTGPSSADSLTLVVPAGWGQAFWESLVFTCARVGGLSQRSQAHFESGRPRFPEDAPFTKAFDEHEVRRRAEDEAYWLRRPPAKRPSYRKLGSKDPFASALGSVVESWFDGVDIDSGKGEEKQKEGYYWTASTSLPFAIVSVLRGDPRHSRPDGGSSSWLSNAYDHAKSIVDAWRSLTTANGQGATANSRRLLKGVVVVRLRPVARGAPEELGYVYYIDDERLGRYTEKTEGKIESDEGLKVMGRVTTGSYSLTKGRGEGTACVSLVAWLKMAERALSSSSTQGGGGGMVVVFRNRDSTEYKLGTLDMIQMLQQ